MNKFTSPQLFISTEVKTLGLELIKELYIQRTAPLAFYLDVNPSFDGHEAVFFWIRNYLEEYPEAVFTEIRNRFISLIPEC
ncbi:hypothetical protein P256_02529 [Acinetobacter nectaris CIP 110549]|uniref:Uncharacterized protein n=1 Tax=Acinetobacter nectaris CIP 110549 TaxID=1392540 RepID=V2TF82_9GAMM|nr:hypothetical protein [Acinetobacter nectaris]ESK36617.1 hypothetical protein P256_02529 [Acinetobacter nectaris CIP 110549]